MAVHSDGEKQFEATASHLERARRQGNVARSSELSAVTAFACATLALCGAVAPFASSIKLMLAAGLTAASSGVAATSFHALAMLGALSLLPVAAGACGATMVSLLQSGGLRLVPVTFALEKLNPGRGVKRIFSRETILCVLRALLAFACAALVLLPALRATFLAGIGQSSGERLGALTWYGALRVVFAACALGIVFSGLDFALEFWRWKKKLRMSFEECRRDRKEHDGDPTVRGRRRALHRSFSTGSLAQIKDAAFVVTNPTHFAVALEYRPPDIPVPRVLVRSADEAALRVRALAKVHSIPIVENVALARGLYAACDAGHVIPRESYVAVAEIIAALTRAGAVA